ncbi:MAG: hypothetical protein NTW10_02410 [Bacteroidetes bacterium]|nr:hypothetical protein [Bacteroidota bacterium]
MKTKIITKNGAYIVVTEGGTLLTPLVSLEQAKRYKTVIDSYHKEKERLGPEPSITKKDTKLPEALDIPSPLPEYLKTLNSKLDLSQAGQGFIISRPGLKTEQSKIKISFGEKQDTPKISEENHRMLINGLILEYKKYASEFYGPSVERISQRFKTYVLKEIPEIPESIIDEALHHKYDQADLSKENLNRIISEIKYLTQATATEPPDFKDKAFQSKIKANILIIYPNIPTVLLDETFYYWSE